MQSESICPTLPNLAQRILGSGQRLQCDEVITYSLTVGVHLQNTHRGSVKRRKAHVRLNTLTPWRQQSARVQNWEIQAADAERMHGRTACADATEPCCCEMNRSTTATVSLRGVKCSIDFDPRSIHIPYIWSPATMQIEASYSKKNYNEEP